MTQIWIALLLAGLGSASQAAPFQNGGFELGPAVGQFANYSAGATVIPGWTVIGSGGIDYIGTYWQHAASSTRSLDLGGNPTAGDAGVEQTFDTVAGATYEVGFYIAANTGCLPVIKTMDVRVNPPGLANTYSFDGTGHSTAAMGWTAHTFTFVASGASTTLSFTTPDNTFCGPALDEVSVTLRAGPTPEAVPTLSEAATLVLGTGLALLAWSRLRRPRRGGANRLTTRT